MVHFNMILTFLIFKIIQFLFYLLFYFRLNPEQVVVANDLGQLQVWQFGGMIKSYISFVL